MVVRGDHPRIWVEPARRARLEAKIGGLTAAGVAQMAGGAAPGMALTALLTKDGAPCHAAMAKHAREGETGRSPLYHLALLYDWCDPYLDAEEKKKLRGILVPAMEKDMRSGRLWRSFHNAGHTAVFTLTAAALALYPDPVAVKALDFVEPELEDMLQTLDEVFPDGEWAEGADYARHASHHALRTLLAIKSATGKDFLAPSPHLRHVAQYIFYAAKPNGLMFNGDDNDWPHLSTWEHSALLMIASEYGDPHAQWFLEHCPRASCERFELSERDRWADLLWYDPNTPRQKLDDLPLSRIFRGKGLVLARSGWGLDDDARDRDGTWLAFTNGDYFGDHDHYDVNAFQIFRRGDLAIDSGRYDDDWDSTQKPEKIARSQLFNYYQRTIAHNTMLVHDPSEDFGRGLLNDGGQRHLLWRGKYRNVPEDFAQGTFPSDEGAGRSDWSTNPGRWERGNITAYASSADFVFVRGDGAPAYSAQKLSAFVRELVFVRPSLVVVFDRVVSTNPSFAKTWLLHTIEEPRLPPDGSWFEVTAGQGRLFGVPVLPEGRRLVKVGGPGDEFTVAGVKFKAGPQSELNPSALHYGENPGAWRIEERPSRAQSEDHFANVMLVTHRASTERPQVETVTNDDASLVLRMRFDGEASGASTVTLRFAKGSKPATSMKIERGAKVAFDAALPDAIVLEERRAP